MAVPSNQGLLAEALAEHLNASLNLIRVALELEWTILTRFIVGVAVATLLSVVYLLWSLRNTKQPLVVWEKLNRPMVKLFRAWIFATIHRNVNPYVGSIDIRVSTLSKGFCTGILRDRKTTHNQFKSIHPMALATFAETVGGLATHSTLKKEDKANLFNFSIEYMKTARGLLTASSEFKLPLETSSKDVVEQEVVIKDRMLDTVAVAKLVWQLEQKEKDQ
ncbi:hypothetical protein BGW37DRAFT_491009 [Umbelopsis sp. PMI_123]|nr:hypothetical protein BGW37DRAFT_491009 [Umbelopsis sp. PMI_123]